jgi:hypothetical protein
MSDETRNDETTAIPAERRALMDRFWEHARARDRAWAKEMATLHLIISEPARFEELERRAIEAAAEKTAAEKAMDTIRIETEYSFPTRVVEMPDAGAWKPILALLSTYGRELAKAEAKEKP